MQAGAEIATSSLASTTGGAWWRMAALSLESKSLRPDWDAARNGLGDQRLLWFQTAMKLAKTRLGMTM